MVNSIMDENFWNDRFQNQEYAYGTQPNEFLKHSVKYIPVSGKVLSLAEGEGRNAVFLAENHFTTFAVDFSTEGKKKAEQLATQKNVTFQYTVSHLDHFDLGFEQWDAVISIFGYLGPNRLARKQVYSRIQNALKPKGVFILEAYHPNQLNHQTGGPKDIDMLITLKELTETFLTAKIIHAKELNRTVLEGQYHTGLSAVTQLIYQKQI